MDGVARPNVRCNGKVGIAPLRGFVLGRTYAAISCA